MIRQAVYLRWTDIGHHDTFDASMQWDLFPVAWHELAVPPCSVAAGTAAPTRRPRAARAGPPRESAMTRDASSNLPFMQQRLVCQGIAAAEDCMLS